MYDAHIASEVQVVFYIDSGDVYEVYIDADEEIQLHINTEEEFSVEL